MTKSSAGAAMSVLAKDSSAMWRELYMQSNQLRGPLHFQSVHSSQIDFELVSSIFEGARRAPGSVKLNYFRGYVGGREDYRLAERFLEQNLSPKTISSTITRLFCAPSPIFGERPGLVVNGGLQWSGAAQHCLAAAAEALTEVSEDLFTIDLTLFIGSYGATPFGAHIDDSSHRTVLFNLGPNEKIIKIWNRPDVEHQFGMVRNVYDFDAISARASSFCLARGDCFVLPSTQFHVGINQNVSTAVAIVLDYPREGSLAAQELAFHRAELDKLGDSHPLARQNVHGLVEMARLRNISNCRLRYPISPHPTELAKLKRSSFLRLVSPFRHQVYRFNKSELIFSRGRHYLCTSPISAALNRLGDMASIRTDQFIQIADQGGCDVEEALRVIDFLLSTSGLTFHD
ncbi:hypothetical protein [Caballeronia sp. ATUFL_M1_KS5A]|uniref:hypothetical protein n=1 Tax=Caballeronia sp. ATUFL_M1_KS5A TaxID=2921778 RepID=UPI0020285CDA|nr:hypothetical protein [Caballeronia sp. ATUFL_M1_KS5A]